MGMEPDGTFRVLADGLHYRNGIAREADGNLVITEGNGLVRLHLDGSKEWIVKNLSDRHATDGMTGTVLMWRDMPRPGLPVYSWHVPAAIRDATYGLSATLASAFTGQSER